MSTPLTPEQALEQGNGLLRLAPTWVPRSFCVPGRRIKLHPHDYYALGAIRGGIDERWLSSTVKADNGPLTNPEEGLSIVVDREGNRVAPLADVVDGLRGGLLGEQFFATHGRWPMYSKFFDNDGPLPYHIHHREEHAKLVGRTEKPEAYYYPPQMNNHGGTLPVSYFGLQPHVTRDQLHDRLSMWGTADNRITELALGFRLEPGTGWDIPAGVLHAPGSLCTYEPQKDSDVFAMCECVNNGRGVPDELLWKDVPENRHGDIDFILELVDWDRNADPHFAHNRYMAPIPVHSDAEVAEHGFQIRWVVYRSPDFSAKEITILPGRTVTLTDPLAYGFICVQGHGVIAGNALESPTLIRFGQLTHDEYFVSEPAARAGVVVENPSTTDPIVLLCHFGPGHPERPQLVEI